MNMPLKIDFNNDNYNLCKIISDELDKLYKSYNIMNV